MAAIVGHEPSCFLKLYETNTSATSSRYGKIAAPHGQENAASDDGSRLSQSRRLYFLNLTAKYHLPNDGFLYAAANSQLIGGPILRLP